MIGGLDERAVVLDDDDGVAGGGELAAEVREPRRVARVQADRRLVQDVQRADELRAELVGQVDTLRLAARQRAGLARQREIPETNAEEEVELGAEGGGYLEIRKGIAVGETVVTSSQFLIDSESNLKAAINQMTGGEAAPTSGTEAPASNPPAHIHQ